MGDTEVLICQEGHEWEREVTRGRKPLWCAEHRPVIENGTSGLTPEERLERARNSKKARAEAAFDGLIQKAREANFVGEQVPQVNYIIDQLTTKQRKQSDIIILSDRLKELVREYERNLQGR